MPKLRMGDFSFDWDPAKDAENERKHGVSFRQAATLWGHSEHVLDIADTRFTYGEDRWIALGPLPNDLRKLIAVAYCDRGDVIRIISARKAEKCERAAYHKRMQGMDL